METSSLVKRDGQSRNVVETNLLREQRRGGECQVKQRRGVSVTDAALINWDLRNFKKF